MDDETRRALGAEDRVAAEPAEKSRVSHDEEPEVEGHRFAARETEGVRRAGEAARRVS